MEANLEELIDLDELVVYVAVSRRQLERLFLFRTARRRATTLKLRLIQPGSCSQTP